MIIIFLNLTERKNNSRKLHSKSWKHEIKGNYSFNPSRKS